MVPRARRGAGSGLVRAGSRVDGDEGASGGSWLCPHGGAPLTATLLPDPPPRPRRHTIVSVDDHLIEPPDLFEGRLPAALQDRAPTIVTDAEGRQAWHFDGSAYPNIGLNAVVGRPRSEWSMEPARFDEMRPGCWDPRERLADMDRGGVWASLCFPSLVAGFAGTVFFRCSDPALGLACVRAWNDWHHEVWCAAARDRLVALQIPWLGDPDVAAAEVRRNAARGFRAVSFVENPAHIGLPSVHTRHWDPFLAACEETGTVVCLHTGSSGWSPVRSPEAPIEQITTMFPANAAVTAADWLWAGIPLRFPHLRVALSEGGIGWVPMLLDRLDYIADHSASGRDAGARWWRGADMRPSEALQRRFWFCTIDDPSTLALVDRIGTDRVMVEVDYPHADSSWPDTQPLLADRVAGLPAATVEAITWANAAALFGFDVDDAAVAAWKAAVA